MIWLFCDYEEDNLPGQIDIFEEGEDGSLEIKEELIG